MTHALALVDQRKTFEACVIMPQRMRVMLLYMGQRILT